MKRIFTIGLLGLFVPGCGGESTSTSVYEGKVADGYLVGATVCLDMNDNAVCDADEPSAVSTEGGVYQLSIPATITASDYPLIVDVPASAIDEDTQMAVGQAYSLSAPAGQTFVSPITTLIHQQYKQTPSLTLEQIETDLKFKLGRADSATSLAEDYIANTDTELHSIAQVVAQLMADRQEALNTIATDNSYEPNAVKDNVQALIHTEIQSNLYQIASLLETNTVSETVSGMAKRLTTSELADLQASLERETTRQTSGFDWSTYLATLNSAYLLGNDFAIQFEDIKGTLSATVYQSTDVMTYTYTVDTENSHLLTLDDGAGATASLTLVNIGENGAVSLQWMNNAEIVKSVVAYPSQVLNDDLINQTRLSDGDALDFAFYQLNNDACTLENTVDINDELSNAIWSIDDLGLFVSVLEEGRFETTETRFIFNEISTLSEDQFQGLKLTFVNDEFTSLEAIQGLKTSNEIDAGACEIDTGGGDLTISF